MQKKISALCFLFVLVANVCFAEGWEGTPVCGLGAERLYDKILEAGRNNGISSNEFTPLRESMIGGAYFFECPRSDPNITNNIMLSINNDGYVTVISIEGSSINNKNVNSMSALTILCLQAIGLSGDEIAYITNNFKRNNSSLRNTIRLHELYTSNMYVPKLHRTITLYYDIEPNARINIMVSANF